MDRGRSGPADEPPAGPDRTWRGVVAWLLVTLLVLSWFGGGLRPASHAMSYSDFKSAVREGAFDTVVIRGARIEASADIDQPPAPRATPPRATTWIPSTGDPSLLELLEAHGVDVVAEPESTWRSLVVGLLPWLVLIGVYVWVMRRFSRNLPGGMGGLGGALKGRAGSEATRPKTRFRDVAGQASAKAEVAELVEFLRDPDRYLRLGARPPRGVLLMGPPGTGKTLLARALAGEAEVPFFSMSASAFIEVFVGVGASRVRQLFEQARKQAPSIVFIDELDSIGRTRGTGLGGGHDEREQTLNQILAELDGFDSKQAVVVLAATNRPDVLDPALLRPGRFDRHITLDLPDRTAREDLLALHCERVPLARDVDLARVARATPGFSGADLANLVNEAAMRAARDERDQVSAADFEAMRDRVVMGAERRLAMRDDERHRLAAHESGHAAVGFFLADADPVHSVSIIPRGKSLGATQQLPAQERYVLPENYLRAQLAVLLAGRAAEQVLLGTVSSGADDDINKATELARAMVSRWGMDDAVGPVDLRDSEEHPFLGRCMAQPRRHSEASARAVDRAVAALLAGAEALARATVSSNEAAVRRLAGALEARERLGRAAIERCLSDGASGASVLPFTKDGAADAQPPAV